MFIFLSDGFNYLRILIKVLIWVYKYSVFNGGNVALTSLIKRKKDTGKALPMLEPLKPLESAVAKPERHVDDLEVSLPLPSIPEETEKAPSLPSAPPKAAPPMPTFPEIPKEEAKAEEIPLPEIPEELPELEELPPEVKAEIKEAPAEIIPEIEIPEAKEKPIFINLDKYKAVIETLNTMRSNLLKYSELPTKMADIKISKDTTYEKFRNVLEDVERKLLYIDKNVFGGLK